MLSEGLHVKLKPIWDAFSDFCERNQAQYDIASDEHDRQGYIIRSKEHFQALVDLLRPIADSNSVRMQIDTDRRGGPLFTFTLGAIEDQGHWQVLSKKRKSWEFSPFANKEDAKKVRAKKMPIQREDQYKFSSNANKRKQRAFRSSFTPISEFEQKVSAVLEMILPMIEKPLDVGLNQGPRTNGTGEDVNVATINQRQDAVDLPQLPPPITNGLGMPDGASAVTNVNVGPSRGYQGPKVTRARKLMHPLRDNVPNL